MPARILVVDDEPDILNMLSCLLRTEGYEVTTALGGEEACKILNSQEFDLMITDIRMSPINGMQLLELAHERYPLMSVIMMTAYGQVDTAIKAMELGAFDYIKKPFKADELLKTVVNALKTSQLMKNQYEKE